jgi:hypothetical protein
MNQKDSDENTFKARNGKTYTIELDDDSEVIVKLDGMEVGVFNLHFVEHDHPSLGHYYITNMEIEPNHKMQGIGTEILKRHKQQYGLSIRAAENDGQRRDDGSHLTGDAPGFVSRMKERGLIECEPNDFNPDDDLG